VETSFLIRMMTQKMMILVSKLSHKVIHYFHIILNTFVCQLQPRATEIVSSDLTWEHLVLECRLSRRKSAVIPIVNTKK